MDKLSSYVISCFFHFLNYYYIMNNEINVECCVCYEDTNNRTKCNHVVCKDCIKKVELCPMCRIKLPITIDDLLKDIQNAYNNRILRIIFNREIPKIRNSYIRKFGYNFGEYDCTTYE